jgi:solute carrier family 25 carnitine/acylcarnitine transporter 20/29
MRTPSLDISKTPFEMVITVGTRYGMYVVIIYFFRAKSKVTTDADDFFSINIKTRPLLSGRRQWPRCFSLNGINFTKSFLKHTIYRPDTMTTGEQDGDKKAAKEALHDGSLAGTGSSLKEAFYGLAGGVLFGMVSPIVGHPLDTCKTRMQVEHAYRNSGFLETVRRVHKTEGIRGFYRGFIPPLFGSMAYRGVLFSAYSGTYSMCEGVPILHEPIPFTGGLRPSVLLGALAAAVARASIESPLDFIKVRYMIGKNIEDSSSTKGASSSVMSSARSFAASPVQSIAHLYHGFVPTLLRTIGLLGSFFVMVDYSVRYIPEVVNAPTIGPFFKGGVCATAAWTIAFPFESVKSRIQADTTGKYKQLRGATWKVMLELYRERGIVKGLYRGFGPGAGRSFLANGVSMTVYSWFQGFMRKERL